MNRLQKKCFIAATGMHLLLLVILLVGPAFLSSRSKPDDSQVIDFIPANLIDKAFANAGGGAEVKPTPVTPQPAPVQPTPPVPKLVEPVKVVKPAAPPPVKEIVKATKPNPESLETTKPPKTKPQINLTPVVRNPADARAQAQAAAEANRRKQINEAMRNLRSGLSSSSTTIEAKTNPGGGGTGEAYAGYAMVVKSIYETQWVPPDNTASDNATAKVTVTIASDGTVISARITTPSGDEQTDASIQRTLDRVKFIAPFPKDWKDTQRTYIINFNLKAKRLSA